MVAKYSQRYPGWQGWNMIKIILPAENCHKFIICKGGMARFGVLISEVGTLKSGLCYFHFQNELILKEVNMPDKAV